MYKSESHLSTSVFLHCVYPCGRCPRHGHRVTMGLVWERFVRRITLLMKYVQCQPRWSSTTVKHQVSLGLWRNASNPLEFLFVFRVIQVLSNICAKCFVRCFIKKTTCVNNSPNSWICKKKEVVKRKDVNLENLHVFTSLDSMNMYNNRKGLHVKSKPCN